ncbi:MAG: tyrosine-type recombinase/integrase [Acidobacteriaceae bacterium]|nr:tyrosine-type recombinase/integrase [Acidobacteriaceae bacterium]
MEKRTYGTGTVAKGKRKDTWELRYTPKGSGRLSKTIEAPWTKQGRIQAEDALSEWRKELGRQPVPGVKVPMSTLFENHLKDMRRQGRDAYNIYTERNRIKKNLLSIFGKREASLIRKADITAYTDARIQAGAKPATINRELAALRRSLKLALEDGLTVGPIPAIKLLKENNVRKGFIDHQMYRRMLLHLPKHQHMLFCFGYYLGIRIGELLEFRWEWLLPYWNEAEPIIKIPGEVTKSGDPHTIPIYHPDMRAMVEMALATRNPECPYLFQYQGRRLRNPRTGWEKARKAAGMPKLLFHDTRRTAVRLMEQAGIPRAEAMQITGHKTESIYKRYDIGSERGATETGKRLREHWRQLGEQEVQNRAKPAKRPKLGEDVPAAASGNKPRSASKLPN